MNKTKLKQRLKTSWIKSTCTLYWKGMVNTKLWTVLCGNALFLFTQMNQTLSINEEFQWYSYPQIFFSTPEHMCNECFKAQFTSKQLSNSIQMVNGIWQMQMIQLKNNDENTYRTNRKGSASAEQNKSNMQQIWINHQHRLQKMQQLMSFDNLKIWTCGIKESNNRFEQEHQNCEIKQWSRPQQRHSKVNETWYHYCKQMDMVQTQSTMTQQWQCTAELGVTKPKRLHQTQSWLAYTLECKKC